MIEFQKRILYHKFIETNIDSHRLYNQRSTWNIFEI